MWAQHKKLSGFTIIELLVTIVIVGLLATLVAINYNTAQTKTKATNEMSDLKTLNRAIQAYYAENSVYPTTGGAWTGLNRQADFIPSITPKFIAKQPQQTDIGSGNDTTYLYRSDGVNYKLISSRPTGTHAVCTAAISVSPAMADPQRTIAPNCYGFGIWSTSPDGLSSGRDW
jgi:type II secretion system protein G